MQAFFIKLLMLPIALFCEIWGVLLSTVGIFELRFKMFFKRLFEDDVYEEAMYANTKSHRFMFALPVILFTLLEALIITPVFLCARVVNTIMEIIPFIMLPFSLALGFVLGMLVMCFNKAHYCMLDPYKKSYLLPEHLTEVHPTIVITQKMSGMQ